MIIVKHLDVYKLGTAMPYQVGQVQDRNVEYSELYKDNDSSPNLYILQ